MLDVKRLLGGVAAVTMTAGLLTVAATPAEAAIWFTRTIGPFSTQAECEARRAAHEAGLDPEWGFVTPACSPSWYYRYTYRAD